MVTFVIANATALQRNASTYASTRSSAALVSHAHGRMQYTVCGRRAFGRGLTGRVGGLRVHSEQIRVMAAAGGQDAPWVSKPAARCVYICIVLGGGCGVMDSLDGERVRWLEDWFEREREREREREV